MKRRILCALVVVSAFAMAAAPSSTLPERICAAPGLECNIYFENVIDSVVPWTYAFQAYSKKGRSELKRWCWTPTAEDVGSEVEVVVNVWNDTGLVLAATTTVEVATRPVDPTKTLTLALFAASASNGGYPQFLMDDMRMAGYSGYRMVGSRHRGERTGPDVAYYDGYGGYTCNSFLSCYKLSEAEYDNVQDAAEREELKALGMPVKIVHEWQKGLLRSPLVQFRDGKKVVDVRAWMGRVNGGRPADVVIISLGMNAIFTYRGEVPELRERIRQSVIPDFTRMIAALKAEMPQAKFAITTQTLGCGQDGFAANYGAGWNRVQLRKAIVALNRELDDYVKDHAADGVIGLIPIHHGIDPEGAYRKTPVPASARSDVKVERFNNAVHFNESGSRQVGDMIAAWLQCRWNGLVPVDLSRIRFALRLGTASAKEPELTVGPADMESVNVMTNDGTVAVVWRGHPRCGADFTVRATYTPTGDDGWSYAFAYEGNTSGLDVEGVDFPVMEVPRTDKTELLFIHDTGTLMRPNWSKYASGDRIAFAGYNHLGAHFLATLDDTCGGWYIDTRGDSRFHPVKFLFNAGGPGCVRLSVETALACPSGLGDGKLPFGGVIRPFRGGWYEAAMIYRDWVKETDWFKRAKANRAKATKLRDVGLWLWNRGPSGVVTGAIDRVRADAGVPVALDWYWWHKIPYGGEAPYYWPPLEDMGTFCGTIAALKSRGVYVQNYINPMLSDGDDPRWTAKEAAEAIWKRDGCEKSTVYNPFFNHRSVYMCGHAPLFRGKLLSYVRNLCDAGVDGIYLDMVGKGASYPCWNPAHGHPRGGGTACSEGYREMILRMRRENPGVDFSTEGTVESFIEEFESVISLFQSPQRYGIIAPESEMPPVYNAIYRGAITQHGCFVTLDHELPWCHGWPEKDRRQVRKDLVRAYPDQFAVEISRSVANGLQPMVQQLVSAQIDDPRLFEDYRFLCETAKFYYANRDLLYDGEMLNPGTLDCPVKTVTFGGRGSYTKDGDYPEHVQPDLPTVFHSVWRTPSGQAAAVLVNWSRQTQRYALKTPDLSCAGEIPARSWVRVEANSPTR